MTPGAFLASDILPDSHVHISNFKAKCKKIVFNKVSIFQLSNHKIWMFLKQSVWSLGHDITI